MSRMTVPDVAVDFSGEFSAHDIHHIQKKLIIVVRLSRQLPSYAYTVSALSGGHYGGGRK